MASGHDDHGHRSALRGVHRAASSSSGGRGARSQRSRPPVWWTLRNESQIDVLRPRSVTEIGAYAGDLTRMIVGWSTDAGAKVRAIDPDPQPALVQLAAANPQLELVREPSLDALATKVALQSAARS